MPLRRTFKHGVKTEEFVIRTPNILHVFIQNRGTKDIIVEGQIVPPEKWWQLPDGAGVPMVKGFEIEINFTDISTTDNEFYYAVTALVDQPLDQC